MTLGPVCPDHVPDGGPAERALPCPGPLLHGALEAHAHVAARVQHAVHVRLVADDALGLHEGGVEGGGRAGGLGPRVGEAGGAAEGRGGVTGLGGGAGGGAGAGTGAGGGTRAGSGAGLGRC